MKYLLFLLFIPSISFGSIIAGMSYNGYGSDGQCTFLIHCDGADASTNFLNVKGDAPSAEGDAQIDTAQSVFGGASGLFDGTGDFLQGAADNSMLFGTNNFTIDFRIRLAALPSASGVACVLSNWDGGAGKWFAGIYNDGGQYRMFIQEASTSIGETNWAMQTNTWYHYAIVRNGGVVAIYRNGVSSGGGAWARDINSNTALTYATRGGSLNMNGFLDEVRLVKRACWTKNFTVPNRAY